MFAGKSTTILGILRRHAFIGRKTMCVTSSLDSRSSSRIMSHDNESYPAIAVYQLMPLLSSKEFAESAAIIIEEAQFFHDLKEFVLAAIDTKIVIVVGLDGDSNRRPFGQILDLIPFCDSVQKLTALCTRCGDGTPAIFTSRKIPMATQVLVGAADLYEPVCRAHFSCS